jgi:hypothetical protein
VRDDNRVISSVVAAVPGCSLGIAGETPAATSQRLNSVFLKVSASATEL